MPIYEFRCPNNHQFEKLVKTGEEHAECPECGQTADHIISVPSPFQWGKSGGWN